jgi:hypothetical protein
VLLDNDLNKAKGAFSNVDVSIRRIKQDTRLYNTFITLKLALALTKSINASGL